MALPQITVQVLPAIPDLPAPRAVLFAGTEQIGETAFSLEAFKLRLADLLSSRTAVQRHGLTRARALDLTNQVRVEAPGVNLPKSLCDHDTIIMNRQKSMEHRQGIRAYNSGNTVLMMLLCGAKELFDANSCTRIIFLYGERGSKAPVLRLVPKDDLNDTSLPAITSVSMLRFIMSMSVRQPRFAEWLPHEDLLVIARGLLRCYQNMGLPLPDVHPNDQQLVAHLSDRYKTDVRALYDSYMPPIG